MVAVAQRAVAVGFPALKVRFGRADVTDDLAVVRAIRDAVGDVLDVMVDCNQGWRMPWDVRPPWDVDEATSVGEQLAAERVAWMEEPLHRGDYDGMAELRRRVDVPIAGGELTREPYEFAELLRRDCLDVFQPDCVCTQGITGLRRLAAADRGGGPGLHPAHLGQRHRADRQRTPRCRHRRRAGVPSSRSIPRSGPPPGATTCSPRPSRSTAAGG